jgi:hypothetical protein
MKWNFFTTVETKARTRWGWQRDDGVSSPIQFETFDQCRTNARHHGMPADAKYTINDCLFGIQDGRQ